MSEVKLYHVYIKYKKMSCFYHQMYNTFNMSLSALLIVIEELANRKQLLNLGHIFLKIILASTLLHSVYIRNVQSDTITLSYYMLTMDHII